MYWSNCTGAPTDGGLLQSRGAFAFFALALDNRIPVVDFALVFAGPGIENKGEPVELGVGYPT